jgi:hypothetical protein
MKFPTIDEAKKRKLIASGLIAATAIYPMFKKPKPGRRRKKFDPAAFFSLMTFASVLFFDAKKSSPEFDHFMQCKRDRNNNEILCRARYVTESVENLIEMGKNRT